MKPEYRATDADLPPIFGISVVAATKLKINQTAKEMGLELTAEELTKFAVLLIALEQQ